MTPDQLREALRELSGDRSVTFAFADSQDAIASLMVESAMLVPDEPDHLVKVTDGRSIFVVDAERVAYVRIGLNSIHS